MTLLTMCHINLSLDPNRFLEQPNLFLKVHLLLKHCVSKPGVCPIVANQLVLQQGFSAWALLTLGLDNSLLWWAVYV